MDESGPGNQGQECGNQSAVASPSAAVPYPKYGNQAVARLDQIARATRVQTRSGAAPLTSAPGPDRSTRGAIPFARVRGTATRGAVRVHTAIPAGLSMFRVPTTNDACRATRAGPTHDRAWYYGWAPCFGLPDRTETKAGNPADKGQIVGPNARRPRAIRRALETDRGPDGRASLGTRTVSYPDIRDRAATRDPSCGSHFQGRLMSGTRSPARGSRGPAQTSEGSSARGSRAGRWTAHGYGCRHGPGDVWRILPAPGTISGCPPAEGHPTRRAGPAC